MLALTMQANPDALFASGFEDAKIGLIDIRTISGGWSGLSTLGNAGNSWVYPNNCKMQPYIAGANEAAILRVTVTGSTSAAVNDVLYVKPAVSINLSAYSPVAIAENAMADSLLAVTANVTSQARLPLVPGDTYLFGIALATNSPRSFTYGACQATVEIIRTL